MQIVKDIRRNVTALIDRSIKIKDRLGEEVTIEEPFEGIRDIDLYLMILNNIDIPSLFSDLKEYHTVGRNAKKTTGFDTVYWWRRKEEVAT